MLKSIQQDLKIHSYIRSPKREYRLHSTKIETHPSPLAPIPDPSGVSNTLPQVFPGDNFSRKLAERGKFRKKKLDPLNPALNARPGTGAYKRRDYAPDLADLTFMRPRTSVFRSYFSIGPDPQDEIPRIFALPAKACVSLAAIHAPLPDTG